MKNQVGLWKDPTICIIALTEKLFLNFFSKIKKSQLGSFEKNWEGFYDYRTLEKINV